MSFFDVASVVSFVFAVRLVLLGARFPTRCAAQSFRLPFVGVSVSCVCPVRTNVPMLRVLFAFRGVL